MTKTLLRLFWKMGKNQFRTAPDSSKVALVFAGIGGLIVTVLSSFGVGALAIAFPLESYTSFFAYAFSGLLAFNILFGVPQVFKNLYGTNDLAFLFTLPIKTRSIYWVKFLQSFIGVPGILWLFSIILLTVFGIASKANLFFFPIAYTVSLLITLIGMSITYLLNLLLIQIIPVHRAKELMTVMSALAGVIVYVLFQLPNMLQKKNIGEKAIDEMPPMPKWLPMEWGGRSLSEGLSGKAELIVPFILLFLLTASMLFLSSMLVERGFRTGWIKMNEGSRPKKKRIGSKANVNLYHPVIAMGIKEWRTIQRDMREWLTFLPFLFFMIFPFITIFKEEGSLEFILNNPDISWMVAQASFLFMFTFLTGGFASASVAREAYSIHLLQILPLSGLQIALGKFWMNWLIPVVFLTFLQIVGGIFLKWEFLNIIFGIVVVAVMSLGVTGIGLWIGSIGAKYNPNNPQNRLETGVSFLLMGLSFAYLFVAALPSVLLLIPTDSLINFQEGKQLPGIFNILISLLKWKAEHQTILTVISVAMTLIISVGVALLMIVLSAKKMDNGIKIHFVSEKK